MNSSYVFNGVDFSCTYKQFVTNLAKDMGSQTMNALHAAVGISGEAGEIIDAVKKIWIYNKEPDSVYHTNILEELGDLNFYMQYLQNTYHITDEQIIQANIKKLQKRYKQGYSDEAAIARADKKEEVNVQEAINELVDIKSVKTLAEIKKDAAPNTPNKLYNMMANKVEHVSNCSSNNAGVLELPEVINYKFEPEMKTVWLVSRNHTDFINRVYHAGPFNTIEEAYSHVEPGFFMATCEVPA